MSELPIYLRVTGSEANNCFWGYCGCGGSAAHCGSYTSAPVDNLDPQDGGSDITGLPPATVADPSCRPVPCPAPDRRVELQPGDWQPSLAWQSADVRDTAHAAQEAATT